MRTNRIKDEESKTYLTSIPGTRGRIVRTRYLLGLQKRFWTFAEYIFIFAMFLPLLKRIVHISMLASIIFPFFLKHFLHQLIKWSEGCKKMMPRINFPTARSYYFSSERVLLHIHLGAITIPHCRLLLVKRKNDVIILNTTHVALL